MKPVLAIIFVMSAIFVSVISYADSLQLSLYDKPDKQSTVISQVSIPQLQYLIPYYSIKKPTAAQRDWVKVANPSDGDAGWINTRDYMDLMRQAEKNNIKTFEIKETVSPGQSPQLVAYHNGQPISSDQSKTSPNSVFLQVVPQKSGPSKIIAYHNGKKLSDEEAQAWLHKLHTQQQQVIWQDMEMQQQMQQMFRRSFFEFNQMEGEDNGMPTAPSLSSPSVIEPKSDVTPSLSQPLSQISQPTAASGESVDYSVLTQ